MACRLPAVATLTYVYSDSTAVVGPLATYAEPHTYDLCTGHAERLTPPRGWDMVRLTLPPEATPAIPGEAPHHGRLRIGDDLSALADAVREDPAPRPGDAAAPAARDRAADPAAATATAAATDAAPSGDPASIAPWVGGASRGHLRSVRFHD